MDVRMFLKAVRDKLKLELSERKPGYIFSVSTGVSEYGKDGIDYESLFKIADGCLYIAKEKGKDRYIIYDKKLHGNLLNVDISNIRAVNGVDFMKPMDKYDMASSLIIRGLHGGIDVIGEILEELMDRMNIHGISMFSGKDLTCEFTVGHYDNMPQAADYIYNRKYMDMFDEHHINVINNTLALSIDYPEAYQNLRYNGICSSLQILHNVKNKTIRMLQFDTFGDNRRKWSQDDISTVYIVVKAIYDIYDKANV
jgi:hypothetical protein